MTSAAKGHEGVVQRLLAAGANVNASTSSGITVLMASAAKGHAGVVRQLLAGGARVDPRVLLRIMYFGGNIGTSLTISDVLTCIQLLLEAGADVNATMTDGRTVLMMAADSGTDPNRVRIVQALLAAGANVRAVDQHGRTALSIATQRRGQRTVQALQRALASNNQQHSKKQKK
jgi:serine/threonine-protein phosphatase 6 regulatory ankyrin repeat subunit B